MSDSSAVTPVFDICCALAESPRAERMRGRRRTEPNFCGVLRPAPRCVRHVVLSSRDVRVFRRERSLGDADFLNSCVKRRTLRRTR